MVKRLNVYIAIAAMFSLFRLISERQAASKSKWLRLQLCKGFHNAFSIICQWMCIEQLHQRQEVRRGPFLFSDSRNCIGKVQVRVPCQNVPFPLVCILDRQRPYQSYIMLFLFHASDFCGFYCSDAGWRTAI